MKNGFKYLVVAFSLIVFTASFNAQDKRGPHPTLSSDEAMQSVVDESAKLFAADGTHGDNFGADVAISGNTAVAGAWGHSVAANQRPGAVYVFVRNGTSWTLQQKLTASDGADGDGFGISVAIDGDTIVVGAWHDDVGTNGNQGSAYIFVRNGTTWTEQQRLTASDGTPTDEFGYSVAIDGETVIAGAYQADGGGIGDAGAAYVFVRSGAVWTQQQKLIASDGGQGEHFSFVSISGDTALVGAAYDSIGPNSNQGSAYVFVRSGTVWTQQQKLVASDAAANDELGRSVSISGDTAVVGASGDNVGSNTDQGSAYVFVRSGTTWTEQRKLTASDGAANDFFGSVEIEGDKVIVGAHAAIVGFNVAQGAAYTFTRSGTTWTEQQKLVASDGAEADRFGTSVAVGGNKYFAGAYAANIGMANDQGVAYVFIAKLWVSGRIMTAGGAGVPRAIVQMTLANGDTRTVNSSSFGYYRFDDIEADQTVTISVNSKQFQFAPQMVEVNNNLTGVDFIALP